VCNPLSQTLDVFEFYFGRGGGVCTEAKVNLLIFLQFVVALLSV
jgi:hypothetical protein